MKVTFKYGNEVVELETTTDNPDERTRYALNGDASYVAMYGVQDLIRTGLTSFGHTRSPSVYSNRDILAALGSSSIVEILEIAPQLDPVTYPPGVQS